LNVDFSLFHPTSYRNGPIRFGWVGDVNARQSEVFNLLVPAMGGDLAISILSAAATPAEAAQFYNTVDVLLLLAESDTQAPYVYEALACGVFLLNANSAPLPSMVEPRQGGLPVSGNAPDLRSAMQWCAEHPDAVRAGGIRNAQNIALAQGSRDLLPAEPGLVILDDIFPHLMSGFRIAEYNHYLTQFKGAAVYSTGTSFALVGDQRGFHAIRAQYDTQYPAFRGKVQPYHPAHLARARLAYMIFINNAFRFCDELERYQVPFVFCLYPGGGFALNNEQSDAKLRRVFASPCFRKVICTQTVTRDYLIGKRLCPPECIKFVFGVVTPEAQVQAESKQYYGSGKDVLDLCFVAAKYCPQGRDKGYDLFIEAAKRLAIQHADLRFHVVGGFSAQDIDVTALGERIRFYGSLPTAQLAQFYSRMDMILSPNRPFILSPGSFDGFLLGTCIEAGQNGVALFVSDPLRLSPFVDGEELVIIDEDVEHICALISHYRSAPEQLYQLASKGRQRLQDLYSYEKQMLPRIACLQQYLN